MTEAGHVDIPQFAVEPVVIRQFCFYQDLEAVLSLWQNAGSGVQLGRSDTPAEIQKKLQRDPDLFLVAEIEGQVVGAVMGGFDGRRGLVYHLAVAKEHRKKGIGERLMDDLEMRLKAKGCLKCYLLVTYENQYAARFYEKHHWQRMPIHLYGKELL